jgi:hypothetical protein
VASRSYAAPPAWSPAITAWTPCQAKLLSTRWQDAMGDLLEERVPDAGPPPLEEIFRLD